MKAGPMYVTVVVRPSILRTRVVMWFARLLGMLVTVRPVVTRVTDLRTGRQVGLTATAPE